MFKSLIRVVIGCFLFSTAVAANGVSSAGEGFLSEQQVLPQLQLLQQKTAAQHKLFMLVLGADWCHDSKALQQRFNEPELAAALAKRYDIVFVDVGYLEFGRATTQRFQLPLYYGTPTVMIIDPDSGQLLNKPDLMQWTSAANFNAAAYQAYFVDTDFRQQFAQQQQQLGGISPAVLQQISAFEQQQADTLAQGYAYLRPLLRAYKESGQSANAEFNRSWNKVKAFRTRILPQVTELQQKAKTLAPGEPLRLPRTEVLKM